MKSTRKEVNPTADNFITAYCVPGQHCADHPTGNIYEGAGLPEGWKLIPAIVLDGAWVREEHSNARIVCCPDHQHLVEETK